MKIINGIITLALMTSPSFAATLSSVDCSSTEIVLTFDSNVSADDVTTLKIGEGTSPRLKYDLALNGTASGTTITYTVDSTALDEMGKVAPHKAYIFAEGEANGSAECN